MWNIDIYTDGSAAKDRSGWGFVVTFMDNMVVSRSGTQEGATNQQMELTAAIEACKLISEKLQDYPESFNINIYSDSAYLCNCYKDKWFLSWQNNGWRNSKKEPVANRELWEQLIPYFRHTQFNFLKVKGHADNKWNNLADKLATTGKI